MIILFESGIGIDDMFVIVQCLSNIEENDPTFNERPIEILIGETMEHAGVAITITSITDLVVFGVGAITVSLKEKKNPQINFDIFKFFFRLFRRFNRFVFTVLLVFFWFIFYKLLCLQHS